MSERSRLLLRAAALVLLLAAAALFVVVARADRDAVDGMSPASLAQPAMLLLVCIGSAAALWAVSLVPAEQRGPEAPAPAADPAGLAQVQQDVAGMFLRVDELAGLVERLAREIRAAAKSAPDPHEKAKAVERTVVEHLERSLEEIRELAMLTERERQWRLDEARRDRLTGRVSALLRLIDQCQWAQADALFADLLRQYPNDPDVQGAGRQLEDARRRLQDQAVDAETARIELDISAGAWEEALERAMRLSADYPGSERASAILGRVRRDHGAWQAVAAQSLFDSLRQDLEQRFWRRALETAHRLLEKFPNHPHAELVRRQIKLIQDNAEIEQRQEQEIRIRELIRNRQFVEAIQLAEDLLQRFPNSPQAEQIELLLPRIKELSLQADQEEAEATP